MGNKIVQLDRNKKILTVDDAVYDFTPGLYVLIMSKHPRPNQWNSRDYQVYKSLCSQAKVTSFPNPARAVRPHATWKYKHLLMKIVVLGERLTELSEDTDDTDSVESDTVSLADIGEPCGRTAPGILTYDSDVLSSSTHTRSYRKAKKEKDIEHQHPYKGDGVVYRLGDINGIAKKL